ncbi:MAG: hydroxyneurosporene methyltransferase [Acidobacteria bacterium]|nr:hydroxyneurosporene methyltransferase [Acidobacteriota bacterium]
MQAQEPVNLFELSDLCTPWCVHVVATLRIADHIAAGAEELNALAAAANCNADYLGRVLRHLIGKGVFAEPAPGRFALNEAASQLLEPGMLLGLNLDGFGGRMAYAWGTLLKAVRTGAPAYEELFGRPYWEDLDAHPEIAAEFDALMGPAGHGTPDSEILLDGDWESMRTVVDVGGGTGALLAEILLAHPDIKGILVDFPKTVARAAETFAAAGVADRVEIIGQSFFDPLPAGGDLYVLSKVLNDWPDRETVAILKRCAEAAQAKGRIVISGGVSPDDAPASLSIETVLLGGKTNTLAEFRELAREAGLEVSAAGRLPSGRFVIECRPVS